MSKTTALPEISTFEVVATEKSATILIADNDVPAFLKVLPLSLKAILVGVNPLEGKTSFSFACNKEEYFEKFSQNDYYQLLCSKSIA